MVVDITELADVPEIRASLEPLAARRAAQVATAGMLAELRETAAAISGNALTEGALYDLMRFDMKVHRRI
ncbi:FCD domain-containing protein [Arthrobacter sp. MSA 4-2]|uniref:FCD domain-containing protein n=1 Tax=Arthrobacter sp. MSA 4-2 TaxID=2794349 RepID=UPI001E389228|nr:FCD domain-containing protein [Arthrobacter sp. MSA 4-2]